MKFFHSESAMHLRFIRAYRLSSTLSAGALAVVLAASALSGCVVAPAGYYDQGPPGVVVAPPPPRAEYVGVAPFPGAVWITGYWGWRGGRHDWVGGRWAAPPHPEARWVPHEWHNERGGWHQREGHWSR